MRGRDVPAPVGVRGFGAAPRVVTHLLRFRRAPAKSAGEILVLTLDEESAAITTSLRDLMRLEPGRAASRQALAGRRSLNESSGRDRRGYTNSYFQTTNRRR